VDRPPFRPLAAGKIVVTDGVRTRTNSFTGQPELVSSGGRSALAFAATNHSMRRTISREMKLYSMLLGWTRVLTKCSCFNPNPRGLGRYIWLGVIENNHYQR
jgi:hypothetical protein